MTHNHEHTVLEEKRKDTWSKNRHADVYEITDKDVFFAKERHKLHQATPDEGVSVEILKKYFSKKYGF